MHSRSGVNTTTSPSLSTPRAAAPSRDAIEELHDRLLRELAESERETGLHCRHEAGRHEGEVADILHEIAAHAEQTEARIRAQIASAPPIAELFTNAVSRTVSSIRTLGVDRVIAHERSYRATLLGVRQSLDTAHLLLAAAERAFRPQIKSLCEAMIAIREPLVARAADAMIWFVDHPSDALH